MKIGINCYASDGVYSVIFLFYIYFSISMCTTKQLQMFRTHTHTYTTESELPDLDATVALNLEIFELKKLSLLFIPDILTI